MVMVKSERYIAILGSRFNSYVTLSHYKNNEGRAVFLTYRRNAVQSCSYSVTHHLSSQADFHCILCHRGQMGIGELIKKADNFLFIPFVHV